jgi:hypothetical protein
LAHENWDRQAPVWLFIVKRCFSASFSAEPVQVCSTLFKFVQDKKNPAGKNTAFREAAKM